MKKFIIYSIIILFFLVYSGFSFAEVILPWSTTFNCPEWKIYNQPLNCDGIDKGGAWTCGWSYGDVLYEQIIPEANFLRGNGGNGLRHWLGDGENECSGGIVIYFNTGQQEIWMRWYMRYQEGFKGSEGGTGNKVLYFYDTAGSGFMYLVIQWDSSSWRTYAQTGDYQNRTSDGGGWLDLFPSGISDGSWHCFETRVAAETSSSPHNGIWEFWVDGVKKASFNNINWGMLSRNAKISHVLIGSNVKGANNGQCMYVDYDDIAISNTGYIGPLKKRPNPPIGLKII